VIEDVGKRDLGQYGLAMPKLSIALIVCVVLTFMFVRLLLSARGNRDARPLLALIGLAALQAFLVSLRWDYGVTSLRPLQIIISCLLPALAWLSFRVYASHTLSFWTWREGVHLLPAFACLIAIAILPEAIDIIIITTFVAYGVAMLRLSTVGEDHLTRAPLNSIVNLKRALWLVTFTLFGSALTDLLVALDFWRGGGANALLLIGLGNLASLVALAGAALLGSHSIAEPELEESNFIETSNEDLTSVVQAAEKILRESGLAKDPSLTLSRLARRMGLPSRQVSQAVNQIKKRNVSQFVNDVRIAEACRLLQDSELTITQVIYESGFQTKSNFNREFLRVTGKTPRQWREAQIKV
jgi:AraC-like DNA-binding protein